MSLKKVRLIRLGYMLLSAIGTAVLVGILNFFGSPEFKDAVLGIISNPAVATLVTGTVYYVVAEIRNTLLVKKLGTRVGGGSEALVGWNDINLI